jgi:hypothetical protein
MMPALGLIEGYYGTPWSAGARCDSIAMLAPHGYGFYLYAPKTDEFLRRRWREPHPALEFEALAALAAHCRAQDVRFGVGLSPYEIYREFDAGAEAALAAKLSQLSELGLDILAILFDDMRGDLPELAETQARIVHWIAERLPGTQLILCPSYYTDDPILDRVFGQRPENYLEDLGRLLDPAINTFWTGPEVCTREFTPGHLQRVGEAMRRKPFLWDNYPVNDGPRMSQFLHLRSFTGRPASIADHVSGHAVNPALQPVLSCIPALTLAQSYARGEAYDYGQAFLAAATRVCGAALAHSLHEDLILLQDTGLDRLGNYADVLRARYASVDHPAAREIIAWLDGDYRFTGEMA